MKKPHTIVKNKMYNNDAFSKWLGIKLLKVEAGNCVVTMKVRKKMLNGFGIAHGAITYALADSALAFAANAYGMHALSVETSISHTGKVSAGDELTATTTQINKSRKFAIYQIIVINQKGDKVAIFKGTVYFTGKKW